MKPQNRRPGFITGSSNIICAGDTAEDAERLQRLQDCFALFNGSRAFHNYTKRKLYRTGVRNEGAYNGRKRSLRSTASIGKIRAELVYYRV